ncbi:MAG: cyclopropane-fatty-acyl-phospholipid synthase family protein [Pseudomonadota bacterium]
MTSTGTLQPAPQGGTYRPSAAMRMFLKLGDALQEGTLIVRLPDGAEHRFVSERPEPVAEIHVHDDRVAQRFFFRGTLGFHESYLDGDWSSPDIEQVFFVGLANYQRLSEHFFGKPWFRIPNKLFHVLRRNSRRGSKKNIAYHYDLGNEFYEKWLDSSMTYSSALFPSEVPANQVEPASLTEGQLNKYGALANRMGLQQGHSVLEVGCGWGGFAEFAGREIGAKVTGITISQEQFDFASERIFNAGLNEKVDIKLIDYRDVRGSFDRIASIEMFEAVGEKYWPAFYSMLRERLSDGGRAALQIITIDDKDFEIYRSRVDYIQKYIFPGGMLPSLSVLQRGMEKAGLAIDEVASFGTDYAKTLRTWNTTFQRTWPEIRPMGFDDRFKRMWEQYLLCCAAGFQFGCIDVVQVGLRRS